MLRTLAPCLLLSPQVFLNLLISVIENILTEKYATAELFDCSKVSTLPLAATLILVPSSEKNFLFNTLEHGSFGPRVS